MSEVRVNASTSRNSADDTYRAEYVLQLGVTSVSGEFFLNEIL
jgi:hypothetical protein